MLAKQKAKKFALEFYGILEESENKCEYDKLVLIQELYNKYYILKPR